MPRELDELHGALAGVVELPPELFWSGPDPRAVRWDFADRARPRDLYEIVLVEGTIEDIRQFVNGPALVDLWDEMLLPPWVRSAWRPLIDSVRPAPSRVAANRLYQKLGFRLRESQVYRFG